MGQTYRSVFQILSRRNKNKKTKGHIVLKYKKEMKIYNNYVNHR